MRKLAFMLLSAAVLITVQSGCSSKRSNSDGDNEVLASDVTPVDAAGNAIKAGENFMETRTRLTDVNLAPVYFGFDSYTLPPSETAKIEAAIKYLQDNSANVCVVEGHCDERGSNEYNLSLGEQRALTLKTYIVTAGIEENRIQTKSYGKEKPAVMGSGEDVWSKNRRGEFGMYR